MIYSLYKDPIINKKISSDLDYIINSILTSIDGVVSIILTGSFGRGEGSVIIKDQNVNVLNDYDLLLVVHKKISPKKIVDLESQFRKKLLLDYVDIAYWVNGASPESKSIYNFDLIHGSLVIWGDQSVLNNLPKFSSNQIQLSDQYRLLINRLFGVLLGFTTIDSKHKSYFFQTQLIHFFIACYDINLIQLNAYSSSYKDRLLKINNIQNIISFSQEELNEIEWAFSSKLQPSLVSIEQLLLKSNVCFSLLNKLLLFFDEKAFQLSFAFRLKRVLKPIIFKFTISTDLFSLEKCLIDQFNLAEHFLKDDPSFLNQPSSAFLSWRKKSQNLLALWELSK